MLYTRCPACRTTFRITADALREADGNVRCGHCETVFNAHRAEAGNDASGPAGQANDADSTMSGLSWPAEPGDRRRRLWPYAALAAALALAGQGVHHFRAELGAQDAIGPVLARIYEYIGAPLTPRWDLTQYEITDWSARSGPDNAPRNSLVIVAGVHNGGPRAQPYPHVHLRLNDRWGASVGSRTFRPDEYLATNVAADTLMAAGETAQLQLTVVDPGPETYGFELDLCIEPEPGQSTCQSDVIFR